MSTLLSMEDDSEFHLTEIRALIVLRLTWYLFTQASIRANANSKIYISKYFLEI